MRAAGVATLAFACGCSLIYDASDLQGGRRDGGVGERDVGPPVDTGPSVDTGPAADTGPPVDAGPDAGPRTCPDIDAVEPVATCMPAGDTAWACNPKGCALCEVAPMTRIISIPLAAPAASLGVALAAAPATSTPTLAVAVVTEARPEIHHFDVTTGVAGDTLDLQAHSRADGTIADVESAVALAIRRISQTEIAYTLLGEADAASGGSGVWVGSHTTGNAAPTMHTIFGGDGALSEARADPAVVGGDSECDAPVRHVWRYDDPVRGMQLASVARSPGMETYREAPDPLPGFRENKVVGTGGSLVVAHAGADGLAVWDPRGSSTGLLATGEVGPRAFAAALLGTGQTVVFTGGHGGDPTRLSARRGSCARDGSSDTCPAACTLLEPSAVPLIGTIDHLAAEALPNGGTALLYANDAGELRLRFFTETFMPITSGGLEEVLIAYSLSGISRVAIDVWFDATTLWIAGAVLHFENVTAFALSSPLGC